MTERATFALPCRVAKTDAVRQIAYGVVLEPCGPENPDAQGDWYDAADIERAAHGFLETVAKGEGGADLMHADDGEGPLVGYPVESYISPVDFTWGSGDRIELVKAGSWVLAVHYPDPGVWTLVEKGALGAFSVWGSGAREF